MPKQMNQVFLSRKNLLDLLAKLDGVKEGIPSNCAIIKRDTEHLKYPCSTPIIVHAVEDEEYYTERSPGYVASPISYLEFHSAFVEALAKWKAEKKEEENPCQ